MPELIRIALIDDDPAILDSLHLYLRRKDVDTTCFGDAASFLQAKPGLALDCVVADVRMPGMSGLDLVRHLADAAFDVPIVLITGHGDVDMAVQAIKLGAFDFIEKPFDESRLLETIRAAAGQLRLERSETNELAELRERMQGLSDRQRQVMDLAVAGLSNKEIATRLGISPRTVEIHRAWMMERMGAKNLAELVRMGMQLKHAG
jgi:RNA polymerase sigma factor (sigma-70 family)